MVPRHLGGRPTALAFTTVVFFQVFHLLNVRSETRTVFRRARR